MDGTAAYARRFRRTFGFYQGLAAAAVRDGGQTRVERFDGGLEVIDEKGLPAVELRPALGSAFAALSDDLTGFCW